MSLDRVVFEPSIWHTFQDGDGKDSHVQVCSRGQRQHSATLCLTFTPSWSAGLALTVRAHCLWARCCLVLKHFTFVLATCNHQTQAQLEAAMSYYVGAEPRNPVQCEKFWRNRIDAEEARGLRENRSWESAKFGECGLEPGCSCSGHGKLSVAWLTAT